MKEGVSLPSLLPIQERLNTPWHMQCMESSSYRKLALMPSELGVGIQVLALGLAYWKGWPLWKRESALAPVGSDRATTGQS